VIPFPDFPCPLKHGGQGFFAFFRMGSDSYDRGTKSSKRSKSRKDEEEVNRKDVENNHTE
jgi:hypothetical protein